MADVASRLGKSPDPRKSPKKSGLGLGLGVRSIDRGHSLLVMAASTNTAATAGSSTPSADAASAAAGGLTEYEQHQQRITDLIDRFYAPILRYLEQPLYAPGATQHAKGKERAQLREFI